MFVKVALNVPVDKLFTYRLPATMVGLVDVGMRVLVPFGVRKNTGIVVAITEEAVWGEDAEAEGLKGLDKIKDILAPLDDFPLFDRDDLRFFEWLSHYYIYPLGKLLLELLPATARSREDIWVELLPDAVSCASWDGKKPLSQRQCALMEYLSDRQKAVPLGDLERHCGGGKLIGAKLISSLKVLERKGLVRLERRVHTRLLGVSPREAFLRVSPLAHLYLEKSDPADDKVPKKTAASKIGKRQRALLLALSDGKAVGVSKLRADFPNIGGLAKSLKDKGLLEIFYEEKGAEGDFGVKGDVGKSGKSGKSGEAVYELNEDQQNALQEIAAGLQAEKFITYLLHGVTGSGKTEVYLRAMSLVLSQERGSVLYLVPEIALTPRLEEMLRGRFEVPFAIIHSNILPNKRFEQWRAIARGETRLVIGARSAIFAPLRDLRIIIVDEEHDGSYKQEERMRYNARDAAIVRAKMLDAVVVLGSATPSLQTFYNAGQDKYRYLTLPKRVEERPLPSVEIVDIRSAEGEIPIISSRLRSAMERTLLAGEQVLLFLNRRGFSASTFCPSCGEMFKCPACDVSLTLHLEDKSLKCHLCGSTQPQRASCPACGAPRLVSFGAGTERLAREVSALFPKARVERMDSDTTARRSAHTDILRRMGAGEVDILVGTQMIAKGHDFPRITLVGVILADIGMGLPDFRATEKVFQFLMQVAGRSGRGKRVGKVIIQTLNPHHYAIEDVVTHNYHAFYQKEIITRKERGFPPFTRLATITFQSARKESGERKLLEIDRELPALRREFEAVELLGITPPPVFKVRGAYRWRIVIKGKNTTVVGNCARRILQMAQKLRISASVDIDPLSFM